MKKTVKNWLNSLLAAAIVALGFGSCHTAKQAIDEGNAGRTTKHEGDGKTRTGGKNGNDNSNNGPVKYVDRDKDRNEPRPVVYGPPPSLYDKERRPDVKN